MDPASTWFEVLERLREERRPCALVIVTGVAGSAPREVGARLIVADGDIVWGTIGGGQLERQAIERAGELLQRPDRVSESQDYPLGERTGQCCGGQVTLFFETYPWTRHQVVVFGAGHVAQALAGLVGYLGCELQLIDSRDSAEIRPRLPEDPDWSILCVDEPQEEVEGLARGTLVLIMTHDHALDLRILECALKHDGLAYIGLIGSQRKWARFQARLTQRGFSERQIQRVRCPIGISKTSKAPRAIAISVAAELLEILNG